MGLSWSNDSGCGFGGLIRFAHGFFLNIVLLISSFKIGLIEN